MESSRELQFWYCQKFYEKQGNNMKPQSYTEGFSVFSSRISFDGNNQGIAACLWHRRVSVLSFFKELD